MSKSRRMAVIARLQCYREQQQRARLLDARQQHDNQQALLQQLGEYRDDYQQINAPRQGGQDSVQALQNASRFMIDLSMAIDKQQLAGQQAQDEWQQQNEQWQRAQARSDALEALVEECQAEEDRVAEKAQDREAEALWSTINNRK